jgi:anti-sigma28 factor (negative regulator of flagellin synthesis)
MNDIGSSQQLPGILEGIAPANANRTVLADTGVARATQQLATSGGSATTSLSAAAGALVSALSGSDVRMGLVTALRESMGAGTYKVSASDVAGTMLSKLLN